MTTHLYLIVRRRWRKARYLGEPVRPVRWALDVVREDLEVLGRALIGRG